MTTNLPSFLTVQNYRKHGKGSAKRIKASFLDRGIVHLVYLLKTAFMQSESAGYNGLLQKTDARVKVLFLVFFMVIISLKKDIPSELMIGLFLFFLSLASRLHLFYLYKRVLSLGFLFGFLVSLPCIFNPILPGRIILPLYAFNTPLRFMSYHIPQTIGITWEGLALSLLLFLRVVNSLTLSFLVLSTTPFPEIMRALKMFRVPDGFLLIITLSYKYGLILLKTTEDMFLAKKSRLAGGIRGAEGRAWAADRMALLFRKTQLTYEEVFRAMEARGFSGYVRLPARRGSRTMTWPIGLTLLAAGLFFLWI